MSIVSCIVIIMSFDGFQSKKKKKERKKEVRCVRRKHLQIMWREFKHTFGVCEEYAWHRTYFSIHIFQDDIKSVWMNQRKDQSRVWMKSTAHTKSDIIIIRKKNTAPIIKNREKKIRQAFLFAKKNHFRIYLSRNTHHTKNHEWILTEKEYYNQ